MGKNKKRSDKVEKRNLSIAPKPPLGDEQLTREMMGIKKFVENLNDTVSIYLQTIQDIRKNYECFQFQSIEQDLESIKMHTRDLEINGPKDALREIPLEESELAPEKQPWEKKDE